VEKERLNASQTGMSGKTLISLAGAMPLSAI
jgi:hypothetical protein